MGLSRDRRHKRRLTGGRFNINIKKRKYEMARPPSMTKMGEKRIHLVRCRGGNIKKRAMRLDTGSFSWGSESISRKARIVNVVYNASNNELVRTKTLVKSAVIEVDAAPFRQWYEQHYGVVLGKKKAGDAVVAEKAKPSKKLAKKIESRKAGHVLDTHVKDQFNGGRLLACITSRPGQSGRADGYILEGKELEFYQRKIKK